MTAIFYLLLALLGLDVNAAATEKSERPRTEAQVRQAVKGNSSTGNTPIGNFKGGGHGGSRNIGGPVIVFDDVLFRPTE